MAFLGDINEKLDGVEAQSFELLPDGWYTAVVKDVTVAPTKDGTGQRMNVRFDITGPTRSGAVIFEGLNIRNKNEQAEKIALQQLRALRDAVGIVALQDTDQFIGRALQVKVATQPAKDGYEARNVTKGFKPVEGGSPAPMPAVAVAKPAASSIPPWARKQEPVAETKIEEPKQPEIF
jgi:hypothetical protein